MRMSQGKKIQCLCLGKIRKPQLFWCKQEFVPRVLTHSHSGIQIFAICNSDYKSIIYSHFIHTSSYGEICARVILQAVSRCVSLRCFNARLVSQFTSQLEFVLCSKNLNSAKKMFESHVPVYVDAFHHIQWLFVVIGWLWGDMLQQDLRPYGTFPTRFGVNGVWNETPAFVNLPATRLCSEFRSLTEDY